MCGRFALTASHDILAELMAIRAAEPYPPRYNIAPTQPILIVAGGRRERPDADNPERQARLVRWGLIPSWVKDLKGFPLLFNARSESTHEKSAFRAAMRHRRCLVPATGFYEWRRQGKAKAEPYFVRPKVGGLMAFAGLFETWLAPDGGELDTATILTTAANSTLSPIHERMPVVVAPRDFDRWLNCWENDAPAVAGLLRPANDDLLEAIPVSDKVNRIANMGPEVQAPLDRAMTERPASNQASPRPDDAPDDEPPVQPSLF
ncbi:SOS response-associated peptidase [Consotaella aegiceratis]|uniref:SOS response-associated peptidase n=1 Tax=Consotaella aegiceratis TaxID=3097961 RepID=UPI002F42B0FB